MIWIFGPRGLRTALACAGVDATQCWADDLDGDAACLVPTDPRTIERLELWLNERPGPDPDATTVLAHTVEETAAG